MKSIFIGLMFLCLLKPSHAMMNQVVPLEAPDQEAALADIAQTVRMMAQHGAIFEEERHFIENSLIQGYIKIGLKYALGQSGLPADRAKAYDYFIKAYRLALAQVGARGAEHELNNFGHAFPMTRLADELRCIITYFTHAFFSTDEIRDLFQSEKVGDQLAIRIKSLFKAAEHNYPFLLKLVLVRDTPLLPTQDSKGRTALKIAVDKAHVALAEQLCIGNNSNLINTADATNETPFEKAVKNGFLELTQVFIMHGGDLEVVGEEGKSLLHCAAELGYDPLAQLLINNRHPVEPRDHRERTPLHSAAVTGKKSAVKLLLKNKASLNPTDNEGFTPVHCAALQGHLGVIDKLVKYGALITTETNTENEYPGNSLLHSAAFEGHDTVVAYLLSKGLKPSSRSHSLSTPLHLAAEQGHRAVMITLLDHGADIHVIDAQGETPLHLASANWHFACVELLVQRRALIKARNADQMTPLRCALVSWRPRSQGGVLDLTDITDNQRRTVGILLAASRGSQVHVDQRDIDKVLTETRAEEQRKEAENYNARQLERDIVRALAERRAEEQRKEAENHNRVRQEEFGDALSRSCKTMNNLIDGGIV